MRVGTQDLVNIYVRTIRPRSACAENLTDSTQLLHKSPFALPTVTSLDSGQLVPTSSPTTSDARSAVRRQLRCCQRVVNTVYLSAVRGSCARQKFVLHKFGHHHHPTIEYCSWSSVSRQPKSTHVIYSLLSSTILQPSPPPFLTFFASLRILGFHQPPFVYAVFFVCG